MSDYPKTMTKDGKKAVLRNRTQERAYLKAGWVCAASQPSEDGLDGKTVEELTAIAAERGIDIGSATSVSGILKKIRGG